MPTTDAKYQHLTFAGSIYPTCFTLACLNISVMKLYVLQTNPYPCVNPPKTKWSFNPKAKSWDGKYSSLVNDAVRMCILRRKRCFKRMRDFRWGLWSIGISCQLPSLQLLLSMFSRNGWRKFGQKSFSISPIDWTLIPPFPQAHHPLTVIITICYPTPGFIHVVSSGPLWPTFYHYKS